MQRHLLLYEQNGYRYRSRVSDRVSVSYSNGGVFFASWQMFADWAIRSIIFTGRFLSGNETKHTRKAMCFWGVGTSALTLSSAFGTIIASIAAPEAVRSRIVMTSYDAESFRQASEGVDAYKMVYTPWVNVFLGLLTAAVLVIMFMNKSPKSDISETESN